MTPLAWIVLAAAAASIAAAALARALLLARTSPQEAERLRRLALGEGPPAPTAPTPPAAPDDWFGRRMEELGWKGAIRAWLDELTHPASDTRSRASEALWMLARDDPDVVDDLIVLLDDGGERADAVADVLAGLIPQARAKLEERARHGGRGGERARELLDVPG